MEDQCHQKALLKTHHCLTVRAPSPQHCTWNKIWVGPLQLKLPIIHCRGISQHGPAHGLWVSPTPGHFSLQHDLCQEGDLVESPWTHHWQLCAQHCCAQPGPRCPCWWEGTVLQQHGSKRIPSIASGPHGWQVWASFCQPMSFRTPAYSDLPAEAARPWREPCPISCLHTHCQVLRSARELPGQWHWLTPAEICRLLLTWHGYEKQIWDCIKLLVCSAAVKNAPEIQDLPTSSWHVAIPARRQGLKSSELDVPAPGDTVLRCCHWPHVHGVMPSLAVPRAHMSEGFDYDIFFKKKQK